jgi:hypothetical protein
MINFKKGQVAPSWVIAIAIFVLTLVIVFIFLSNTGFTSIFYSGVNQDTCKQSIVLRSSANLGPLQLTKKEIPLQCQTEKYCFTSTGKDCPEFGAADQSKMIFNDRISKNNSLAKQQILDRITEQLRQCNDMLGDGQLKFMPNNNFQTKYCLICSRFKVEDLIRKDISDITYMELFDYMEKKRTNDGISYLESVYKVKRAREMEPLLNVVKDVVKKSSGQDVSTDDLKIRLNDPGSEGKIVIAASIISAGTWGSTAAAAGAGILTFGAIALAPFTGGASLGIVAVGAALVSGATAGSAVAGLVLVSTFPDGSKYLRPFPYPDDIQNLRNMECYNFETAP